MSIEQLSTVAIQQLAREGRVAANLPQSTARATVLSNRFCEPIVPGVFPQSAGASRIGCMFLSRPVAERKGRSAMKSRSQ